MGVLSRAGRQGEFQPPKLQAVELCLLASLMTQQRLGCGLESFQTVKLPSLTFR